MEIRDAMLDAFRTQKPNQVGELAICRRDSQGENLCIIFHPEKNEPIYTANGDKWVPAYEDLTAVNWHLAARVPHLVD